MKKNIITGLALLIIVAGAYFGYRAYSGSASRQIVTQTGQTAEKIVTMLQNNITSRTPTTLILQENSVTVNNEVFNFASPAKVIAMPDDTGHKIAIIGTDGNLVDNLTCGVAEGSEWSLFRISDSRTTRNLIIDMSAKKVTLKKLPKQ